VTGFLEERKKVSPGGRRPGVVPNEFTGAAQQARLKIKSTDCEQRTTWAAWKAAEQDRIRHDQDNVVEPRRNTAGIVKQHERNVGRRARINQITGPFLGNGRPKFRVNPHRRQMVEIVDNSGFGAIDRLLVCGGLPCCEPEARFVQTIRLDAEPRQQPHPDLAGLAPLREFEGFFDRLNRLIDTAIHVEVWHSPPFIPVRTRSFDSVSFK